MPANEWPVFLLMCVTMSLTPGPNMMYLTSRALCQGRGAALVSLGGVATGFLIHLTVAASGLAAVLRATPAAYDAIRYAGVAYLLWLAWRALRPGGGALQTSRLPDATPRQLFFMGFMTNALNPQAAFLYLSIFSQFIHPERGGVLGQSLVLGAVQISISFVCNAGLILAASALGRTVAEKPWGLKIQRWVMGGVLGALAVRLALVAPR
ncbi:LysE family translocator [Oleiharenicola sp. Vm1]|uniref:LysE family translocator n=1 Tax=Oleiharenicola sp. Vm1 TaxID=3398393 RepID=UPI0039F61502